MIYVYVNDFEITNFVGEFSLSSNSETIGNQLTFESPNYNYFKITINVGDIITFKSDDTIVFTGIVTEKDMSEKTIKYNAFDFGFYLNKSKDILSFSDVTVSDAILQILNKYNIPIGNIPTIPTIINKIYYDKAISDVLQDILEYEKSITGISYYFEIFDGKFNVFSEIIINPIIKLALNVGGSDINSYLGDVRKTLSIENLKNSIIAYSGGDDGVMTLATSSDDSSISKYGLISDTLKIEDEDLGTASLIADNKLLELNKIEESFNFSAVGDFSVMANRKLAISDLATNTIGTFRIKSVTHDISKGVHTMSVEVILDE